MNFNHMHASICTILTAWKSNTVKKVTKIDIENISEPSYLRIDGPDCSSSGEHFDSC